MRGRTNTDLYSGISLNANTDQFEVSGSNVVAGDFVQYKYAGAEEKILGGVSDGQYFKIDDTFYFDSFARLLKVNSIAGEVEYVDSFNVSISQVEKISDNYYVFLNINTLNGKFNLYFIHVDKIAEKIIIDKEYQLNFQSVSYSGSYSYAYTKVCAISNTKLLMICPVASSGSSSSGYTYRLPYRCMDISDLDNITLLREEIIEGYVNIHTNGFLYFGNYQNYIGGITNNGIARYLFNDDTNLIEKDSITVNTSNEVINNKYDGAWNGRYYLLINDVLSKIYGPGLRIYDLLSGSITSTMQGDNTDISMIAGSGGSTCPVHASNIDEEGYFYLSSGQSWQGSRMAISKLIISSAGVLSKVCTKIYYEKSSYARVPINLGNLALFIYGEYDSTFYYIVVSYVNGDLIIGEQTDMVEPYDGINPKMLLGVAATGGQTGDTIDVYIPLPNT